MTSDRNEAPAEGAKIIVAGGGIVGCVAAGELAAQGADVLLLEPRTALMHEIVRSQEPAQGLFEPALDSRFLQRLCDRLQNLGRLQKSPYLPAAVELATEEILCQLGVRLLYQAFPCSWEKGGGGGSRVSVAVKGEILVLPAQCCVLDASDRAVLLLSAGAALRPVKAPPARMALKVIGIQSTGPRQLRVATSRGDAHLEIESPDANGFATVLVQPVEANAKIATEMHLAAICTELLDALRHAGPAFKATKLVYLGDEPLRHPGLLATDSHDGLVWAEPACLLGAGAWSLAVEQPFSFPRPRELACLGLRLAAATTKEQLNGSSHSAVWNDAEAI